VSGSSVFCVCFVCVLRVPLCSFVCFVSDLCVNFVSSTRDYVVLCGCFVCAFCVLCVCPACALRVLCVCFLCGDLCAICASFVLELSLWETTRKNKPNLLLKTRVWIIIGKLFKYKKRTVPTGCESEGPDCPCKVWTAQFYRNSHCATDALQATGSVLILHKMCSTHLNIWVELFWNSVEIQLNHWFLVMSSFGRPNIVSLQRNTQWFHIMAAVATERINITPSFFAWTFGWRYANLPT